MKQAFSFILFLLLFSCADDVAEPHVLRGNAFGTTYNIQYFSKADFNAQKGIDSVFYLVNRSVNTYMPESDISKINRGDSTVIIDSIFRDVYRLSEEVFKASDGYFDPTIGVLRNAYGFGDVNPMKEIDSVTLDSLRRFVGFNKVKITSEGSIKKMYPQIYFDFNAVAKGYGIDCLGYYFKSQGVDDFLIELGGEILASGINQSTKEAWTVGVESVDSNLEERTYVTVVRLSNAGMASSGNYRKFRIDPVSGKKFVHTINPLTGLAEQSDVTSATVVAADCATADAYATAFMAMGIDRAKVVLKNSKSLEAYLSYVDSTNTPKLFMTEGFPEKKSK